MYQLYHKYKNREFIYILPLLLLSFKEVMQYFFYKLNSGKGFPQSSDSDWYLNYAYSLIADFKIGLHMNDLLYLGYNLLLTLLLAVFKDPHAVIFIQAVTTALSTILIYLIALKLFNRLTAIIAAYFYATSWHIMIWSMYILSDSFFLSLLLLTVFLLLKMLESYRKLYVILFFISTLYMLVFRPTGVLTLLFIFLYLVLNLNKYKIIDFLYRKRYIIGGALFLGIVAIVALSVGHKFDPLIASLQYNAKLVLYNIYAKGWIYDNPSSYDYSYRPNYTNDIFGSLILSFLIHNWDHVLMLYGRRVVAFIGWWVWKTDLRNLAGIIKFCNNLVPTLLFLIGTFAAVRNKVFRKSSIVWLVILSIFIFCMVLFMDSMYRYKLPSLPFIFIVCGYGAERLIYLVLFITKKLVRKLQQWKRTKHSL